MVSQAEARQMEPNIIAGIYIERNGALLLRAEQDKNDAKRLREHTGDDGNRPLLKPIRDSSVSWDPTKRGEALHKLREVFRLAAADENLTSVGIGCFGPYISERGKPLSRLDPETSFEPLRGIDLRTELEDALSSAKRGTDVKITIHTDAAACALGEAWNHGNSPRDVLVFILVTEGIGVGVVTGYAVNKAAHHIEIGPLQVSLHRDDKLKLPLAGMEYEGNLSDQADNRALDKRYVAQFNPPNESLVREAVIACRDKDFWTMRAYYLAQACVATTLLIAPNRTVIGADIDPDPECRLVGLVRNQFEIFELKRSHAREYVLRYEERKDLKKFLSEPHPGHARNRPQSLRHIGALGACVAAAMANREPR